MITPISSAISLTPPSPVVSLSPLLLQLQSSKPLPSHAAPGAWQHLNNSRAYMDGQIETSFHLGGAGQIKLHESSVSQRAQGDLTQCQCWLQRENLCEYPAAGQTQRSPWSSLGSQALAAKMDGQDPCFLCLHRARDVY